MEKGKTLLTGPPGKSLNKVITQVKAFDPLIGKFISPFNLATSSNDSSEKGRPSHRSPTGAPTQDLESQVGQIPCQLGLLPTLLPKSVDFLIYHEKCCGQPKPDDMYIQPPP